MALNRRNTNISYKKNINIDMNMVIECLFLEIVGPITHQTVQTNYHTARHPPPKNSMLKYMKVKQKIFEETNI